MLPPADVRPSPLDCLLHVLEWLPAARPLVDLLAALPKQKGRSLHALDWVPATRPPVDLLAAHPHKGYRLHALQKLQVTQPKAGMEPQHATSFCTQRLRWPAAHVPARQGTWTPHHRV